MRVIKKLTEWQLIRKSLSKNKIGFVPTMGNLHLGHLSLCKRSQTENEMTVVSIFVNPAQFNQPSDFDHYPRTLAADTELLTSQGIDYLLLPEVNELYADH